MIGYWLLASPLHPLFLKSNRHHDFPTSPFQSHPVHQPSSIIIIHKCHHMSSSNIITPWFGLYPSGASWSSSPSDVDHPSGSSLHSTARAMAIRAMHDGIGDQWLDACGWWVWWEGVTWCDLEINTRVFLHCPIQESMKGGCDGYIRLWHSRQPWTWHLFTNTHIQHLHTNILERPTNDQQTTGSMASWDILVSWLNLQSTLLLERLPKQFMLFMWPSLTKAKLTP